MHLRYVKTVLQIRPLKGLSTDVLHLWCKLPAHPQNTSSGTQHHGTQKIEFVFGKYARSGRKFKIEVYFSWFVFLSKIRPIGGLVFGPDRGNRNRPLLYVKVPTTADLFEELWIRRVSFSDDSGLRSYDYSDHCRGGRM